MKYVFFDDIKIGEIIKEKRKFHHLSLNDLSNITSIPQNLLLNYEEGKKQINLNDSISIANALNTSLDELLQYKIK